MEITILEGARGLGKSTISRILRDGMTNTLLINMTGNNDNSEEGKSATFKHYENLMVYLSYEKYDKSPFNFLFDRTFFSEQVYATLYKDYDFTPQFNSLLKQLDNLATRTDVKVRVLFLTADKDTIERNLNREGKAHLFGDSKFSDDVHKSLAQQAMYEKVMLDAKKSATNIRFSRLDLSNLTLDEAVNYVKSQIQ